MQQEIFKILSGKEIRLRAYLCKRGADVKVSAMQYKSDEAVFPHHLCDVDWLQTSTSRSERMVIKTFRIAPGRGGCDNKPDAIKQPEGGSHHRVDKCRKK